MKLRIINPKNISNIKSFLFLKFSIVPNPAKNIKLVKDKNIKRISWIMNVTTN